MTRRRTAARLAWTLIVCARAGAGGPDAAVRADRAGGRPRDGRRRRLGVVRLGRSRVLQLHRLRALGAADVPPRPVGGGQGRTAFHAARRDPQRESRTSVRPYALYLRIRPWTTRDFDIQVGRVPPTFGAFARRTYANDNPLIGYPLALSVPHVAPARLRLPASADELLRMRGRGWLVQLLDRQPGARPRRAARQRVPLGHGRPGARHGRHR